jgi:cold-inducible RNA-binding protein
MFDLAGAERSNHRAAAGSMATLMSPCETGGYGRGGTMKIYVGNLGFSATEEEVLDLFAEYGTVTSIAMINDRDTGRFRGFAFVEMSDEEGAGAISALDGKEVGGRNLRVNEARPREERSEGRQRAPGGQRDVESGGGTSDRRW